MRVVLAFGIVIVTALAICAVILPPPRSDGICERTGLHTSDAEFIQTAVLFSSRLLRLESDEKVAEFLRDNPDCCTVFRERSTEVEATDRSAWWGSVVVRIKRTKPRPVEGTNFLGNSVYLVVSNCKKARYQLTEYLTGG